MTDKMKAPHVAEQQAQKSLCSFIKLQNRKPPCQQKSFRFVHGFDYGKKPPNNGGFVSVTVSVREGSRRPSGVRPDG